MEKVEIFLNDTNSKDITNIMMVSKDFYSVFPKYRVFGKKSRIFYFFYHHPHSLNNEDYSKNNMYSNIRGSYEIF